MTFVFERLKERSTWLGIISIASACGIHLSPDMVSSVATVGAALAGIVLAITPDKRGD